METNQPLAPCLIGRGTLSNYRDMLRALETLESVEYRFIVHGDIVDEGQAALVKLMADQDSATLVVNGCLFLNVASFRYLDFERAKDDRWQFVMHGDESVLEMLSIPEEEGDEAAEPRRPHLLSEEETADFESLILLDDDEDDE